MSNITEITRGNDFDLKFTITTSRAITRARLTVKKQIKDSDSALTTINKQVTSIATTDGQIIQQGGSGLAAIILFKFTKTETSGLIANLDYTYDLECFDIDNKATTPIDGAFQIEERVRLAIG